MKRSPARIELLRSLAADGATVSEAARAIGIAITTVQAWAASELITFPTRSQARKKAWADPEVRARMSEARKKALADPEVRAQIKASRKGAKGVLIPKWVPLDLHDEYPDVAAEQDEFAAAAHIRRLKREMVAA